VLDDFRVFCPGPAVVGVDSDGDGIPDPADGDDDNDGIIDGAQSSSRPLVVSRLGYVQGGGRWWGKFTIREREVRRGGTLAVDAAIRMRSVEVARALQAVPELVGLLVGERRYDKAGCYHSFTNHMISALLTPGGLPIENYQSLVPSRHILPVGGGIGYAAPIDEICLVPRASVLQSGDEIAMEFAFRVP